MRHLLFSAVQRIRLFSTAGGTNPSSVQRKFPFAKTAIAITVPSVATYAYFSTQSQTQEVMKVPALNPDGFVAFTLNEVKPINHNTSAFRFALPEGTTELGLPTASCLVTKFVDGTKEDGKPNVVIRPYTPIEDPAKGVTGYFDLVVKKYSNGPMSSHIFSLKPGQTLDMKGPILKYEYKPNEFKHIGMIAGGTGLTPMIQVIQTIDANPQDKTKVSFIFANIEERDVLMKDYLDTLVTKKPDQFKVYYVLEKPPKGWTQGVGYISESQLKDMMPSPKEGKVFICGPNPMLNHVCGLKNPDRSQGEIGGILKKLGYSENEVFKF